MTKLLSRQHDPASRAGSIRAFLEGVQCATTYDFRFYHSILTIALPTGERVGCEGGGGGVPRGERGCVLSSKSYTYFQPSRVHPRASLPLDSERDRNSKVKSLGELPASRRGNVPSLRSPEHAPGLISISHLRS